MYLVKSILEFCLSLEMSFWIGNTFFQEQKFRNEDIRSKNVANNKKLFPTRKKSRLHLSKSVRENHGRERLLIHRTSYTHMCELIVCLISILDS